MNERRRITLTEWTPSPGHRLSPADTTSLRSAFRNLEIIPDVADGNFTLRNASNEVGVVELDDFTVTINPAKCSPSVVIFMLSYSRNPAEFLKALAPLEDSPDVWEAMVQAYAHQLERALRQGTFRGYRLEEAALATIRGRVRFDDQLRRRYRLVPPVEVQFDDYTDDIIENRLLKAAIRVCHRLQLRSASLRQRLRHVEALLVNVADIEFDAWRIPNLVWTRLNTHLRSAVELAVLILRHTSVTLAEGATKTPGFLVDMATVFEDFVVAGMRTRLHLDERSFPQGVTGRLRLAPNIDLKPDFSWWSANGCLAIGDVKYKATTAQGVLHPDLYQVFAYAVAAQLRHTTLIYARSRTGEVGEAARRTHHVTHADTDLHVEVVDLEAGPRRALAELGRIADGIASRSVTPAAVS